MLSPSVYSPPLSPHRSMRIFHCWKQCCRSSSDSLFMSSVAFAFTATTDSNRVPFNADLIFGNKKKSHGARSGEYGGCSNTVILCFEGIAWYRYVADWHTNWVRKTTLMFVQETGAEGRCSWKWVLGEYSRCLQCVGGGACEAYSISVQKEEDVNKNS